MNPDDITPPEPVPAHTPDQPDAPQRPPEQEDRPAPLPVKLPGQPHAPERVAAGATRA